MQRKLGFVAILGLLSVFALGGAAVATSGPGNSTATIQITFSADGLSATITSTKGISNFTVTLCNGSSFKVNLTTETTSLTLGPFGDQIQSISSKSGTSTQTASRTCGTHVPPDHDGDGNHDHGDGHDGDDVHDHDHVDGDSHPLDHHH
jgi:hypothetical protein